MPAYISLDRDRYIIGHGRFFEVLIDYARKSVADPDVASALEAAGYGRHLMLGSLDQLLRAKVVSQVWQVAHRIVGESSVGTECAIQLDPAVRDEFLRWVKEVEAFLRDVLPKEVEP